MLRNLLHAALVAGAVLAAPAAWAQQPMYSTYGSPPAAEPYSIPPQGSAYQPTQTYSSDALLDAGHAFFGQTSTGLATLLENLLSRFGEPNGYILGEEGSAAVFGGVRYGEGVLNTPSGLRQSVFWQGPSFGWDLGGNGSRVMMLVYNLPSPNHLMQRYTGVDGSAYVVGGLSMTVLAAEQDIFVVPVRTGLGLRLGASIGYLKFTQAPTWNPF